MTEEALRHLLRAHGWTLRIRLLKRHKGSYCYAVRKRDKSKQNEERYLCSVADLEKQSEADMVAKLQKSGKG
jgi:hypothetical protein